MPERFQLPPVITASSWPNVAESIWTQNHRGDVQDDSGDIAPKWTNREAIAVIAALRVAARSIPDGFPLWYQLAAVAYDWEPSTYKDHLTASAQQADGIYPADAAVMLNRELVRITNALDGTQGARPEPRMQLDDVFEDNSMLSDIMQALHDDGSRAMFKIPLPACRGTPGGKPVPPVWDRTERRWKCPGGLIMIDDPLTALLKSLVKPAIVIGLAYVLATGGSVAYKRRRNRRKRR